MLNEYHTSGVSFAGGLRIKVVEDRWRGTYHQSRKSCFNRSTEGIHILVIHLNSFAIKALSQGVFNV